MFTKDKTVGRGRYEVKKKVINWDAVIIAIGFAFIAIVLLGSCSG